MNARSMKASLLTSWMSALHRSHRTAPSTSGLAPRPRPEENVGAASMRSGRRRRRSGGAW